MGVGTVQLRSTEQSECDCQVPLVLSNFRWVCPACGIVSDRQFYEPKPSYLSVNQRIQVDNRREETRLGYHLFKIKAFFSLLKDFEYPLKPFEDFTDATCVKLQIYDARKPSFKDLVERVFLYATGATPAYPISFLKYFRLLEYMINLGENPAMFKELRKKAEKMVRPIDIHDNNIAILRARAKNKEKFEKQLKEISKRFTKFSLIEKKLENYLEDEKKESRVR